VLSSELLPSNYLAVTLAPQGVHHLADPGQASPPRVAKREFPPGNTRGTGLWECTPGTWAITRTNTESFVVLRGAATLHEADGSLRVRLQAGLWHTTPCGWNGRWTVTETVRKMYVLTP
jgi:uncharacterized cupin superfamily protein